MKALKPVKTDTKESRKRICQALKRKPLTANECINKLFKSDVRTGKIKEKDWRYYVHLNKLFAPLSRHGQIKEVGTKIGPTNREEKIWAIN